VPRKRRKPITDTDNLVIVSDQHINCKLALCHPKGAKLDEGGTYKPSRLQRTLWKWWQEFWYDWVPRATDGEPFTVVNNGDALDGTGGRFKNTTMISANPATQQKHAVLILKPIVELCEGRYYHIRGTEVHEGKSGSNAENLATALGAIPDAEGNHARYELAKVVGSRNGRGGGTFHIMHHIGTTGSQQYESSAPMREIAEMLTEAGRWRTKPYTGVVRSHRHRSLQLRIPGADKAGKPCELFAIVTPAWQLKTPFVYRIPGARQSQPQIGGVVIRSHKGVLYATSYVRRIEPPSEE